MATKSLGVIKELNEMRKKLIKTGIHKSQSEVVTDAIGQLVYQYNLSKAPSIGHVRKILDRAAKKAGKSLAQTVREIRDDG